MTRAGLERHATPIPARACIRRVALAGNPNTGKSTLFNALTGLRQRVGNHPGVTVERKIGRLTSGVEIADIPGTYSLAAQSPDETIAVDVVLGRLPTEPVPDAIAVVVDASNLRRNLYLVTQLMELGIPVLVILNLVDAAARSGVHVDAAKLSAELGVPVVPCVARRRRDIEAVRTAILALLEAPVIPEPTWSWPEPIAQAVAGLVGPAETATNGARARRFLAARDLVDETFAEERAFTPRHDPKDLSLARRSLRAAGVLPAELEATMRYGYIAQVLESAVSTRPVGPTASERADAILTHPVLGTGIFLTVMAVLFASIFEWAAPAMDLISGAFDALGGTAGAALGRTPLSGGPLESLVVDGVIAGVGSVLIFVPQITLLFLFIALLETCGYLARGAYLMDRLLRFSGLSGHSFVPMLSSFACAVPGIMATRTIANRRERIVTILVAPLMSCSARIPVYTLMIAAFVPAVTVLGLLPLQGLVFLGMYLVGVVVAVPVALALKKTVLRGRSSPFVMELPPFQRPTLRDVSLRVWLPVRAFVVQAGTIILAMSIVIWALGYFPRSSAAESSAAAARTAAISSHEAGTIDDAALASALATIENEAAGAHLRASALGRMGRAVEPAVTPLGWDWRIGMAAIAAFPAREVVVSTLGIIYDLGAIESGETGLVDRLRSARWPDGRVLFTVPVALSIMVFFALCAQCGATLATIRRETGSNVWPLFAFAYMTAFAYLAAFGTFQLGERLIG